MWDFVAKLCFLPTMNRRGQLLTATASMLTFLIGAEALGANPFGTTPDEPAVYQGTTAATCAWPTTVAVTSFGGLCTGTLIHPEIVVYAAHCGASSGTRIRFGESSSNNPLTVTPEFCRVNPDYNVVSDQAVDWAFCKIAPVQIPVTPPLMGCEYDEMQPGTEVAIVGYGNNQDGGEDGFGAGTKRWAMVSLQGVNLNKNIAVVSEIGEPAICSGDSGGPAFKRMADGGWRAFGITSTGPGGCTDNAGRTHSLISGAVPWIEAQSGVDITPCTDAEGNWEAGPNCGGFNASDPGAAFGSWSNGCVGGPTTGPANTCGPSNTEPQDDTPPSVAITNPKWGDVYPDVPSTVDISIDAVDDHSIRFVRLEINGTDIGVSDKDAPYGFSADFGAKGEYELVAVAQDWSGNSARSEAVIFAVGDDVDVPPDPTTTMGTTSGGTTETSSDTAETTLDGGETGDLPSDGENSGCACDVDDAGSTGGAALATFGLFGLMGLRRRRRHA